MSELLLLPYDGPSHRYWANQKLLEKKGSKLITLPGRHWKWRMHGAASYFSKYLEEISAEPFKKIITTSMLNLVELKGLLAKSYQHLPIHIYFHENQFAYPVGANDPDKNSKRLEHYQFIQIMSFIYADEVFFNSEYNRKTFIKGATSLLSKLPDFKEHLEIGLNRRTNLFKIFFNKSDFNLTKKKNTPEIFFVWNHRWEDDKNPRDFFKFLKFIKKDQIKFKLIILGKETHHEEFKKAKLDFKDQIHHWGEVKERKKYLRLLSLATHTIITSNHDFFGLSALECVLSEVKTVFPKRLCYHEHFSDNEWKLISYDNFREAKERLFFKEIPTWSLKESILKKYTL
ncbi:MAG: hypothetical protein CME61_07455 [Halobacteriovoraceae bacterium]|nr:hypothetical protein [Halobacteriovoraceae bacterium]